MARRPGSANGFVADGYERLRRALQPQIRAEVEREFAERLHAADFWQRLLIGREISREIERRLREAAPPDALY